MGSKIRVGVVGCGGISEAHISSYKANPVCDLVGAADVDIKKAGIKASCHGFNCYSDAADLFDREKPDAVSVCTPPGAHYETVINASERGIHVLCEKPISTSSSEALKMINAAKKNKTIFLVANCHVFHPQIMKLKKALSEDKIGKVTSYRNRFNWGHRDKSVARLRGGALLDNGIHSIYLFRHICGEIKRVTAFFPDETEDIRGLLKFYGVLESVTGTFGIIEIDAFCSSATDKGAMIEVFGDKGSGIVDYSGESYYMTEKSKRKISLVPAKALNRFNGEVNHFINCIRGREKPVIGAIEGFKDLKVAEKFFEAGVKGRTLKISA